MLEGLRGEESIAELCRREGIAAHISNASDQNRHGAINVFCQNLRAYLEGRPLQNVIDWKRGY